MEDYIIYRTVTEIQGTVIRAKSIEDANKKLAKIKADFNKNVFHPDYDSISQDKKDLLSSFDFVGYVNDQTSLPKKTIRVKDANEDWLPLNMMNYKRRKKNAVGK